MEEATPELESALRMPVFVYGTLRMGRSNHHLINQAGTKFKGIGTVPGVLYNLGQFPGMKPGQGVVVGELYHVTPNTMAVLDKLEGHPNFYERRVVPVQMGEGDDTIREAWAYFYQLKVADTLRIPVGDWNQFRPIKVKP